METTLTVLLTLFSTSLRFSCLVAVTTSKIGSFCASDFTLISVAVWQQKKASYVKIKTLTFGTLPIQKKFKKIKIMKTWNTVKPSLLHSNTVYSWSFSISNVLNELRLLRADWTRVSENSLLKLFWSYCLLKASV